MAHKEIYPSYRRYNNWKDLQLSIFGMKCSYKDDKDKTTENKISSNKFAPQYHDRYKIKPGKIQKLNKVKFYKKMAEPALTYDSESWIMEEKDNSKLEA